MKLWYLHSWGKLKPHNDEYIIFFIAIVTEQKQTELGCRVNSQVMIFPTSTYIHLLTT